MARCHLRLGTRGSPLALWQARWVAQALQQHHPGLRLDIVVITTTGDRYRHQPLPALGGKGLFVKEIEAALQRRTIDVAVHSMKDVPTQLPPGLRLSAVPPRGEVRDAFVGRPGCRLTTATGPCTVGTSSRRRQAQLLALRPELCVRDLRGNVETRLRKVRRGEVDGVVLAAVGLQRLGLEAAISEWLSPDVMLPAPGQGALALETREEPWLDALLAPLHDPATASAVSAERAFLAHLGGGCTVPVAALASCEGDTLRLRGLVATVDGRRLLRQELCGPVREAEALGRQLAEQLLAAGAAALLHPEKEA
ncbi:MAG: porphobilinogen deaminase [Candidatus Tectimicrobiota bacterium]|nr:MAG: porphobilinogen deaminase [Candidatus Tectomicrobia bacterium]